MFVLCRARTCRCRLPACSSAECKNSSKIRDATNTFVGKRPRLDELGESRRASTYVLSAIPVSLPLPKYIRLSTTPPTCNLISVPFLPNQCQPVSTSTLGTNISHCLHTLWDTGASESYISSDCLPHVPTSPIAYPEPIDLRLFDGKPSSAGQISHYIDTCIRTSPTSTPLPIRLNVTTLCDADLVLGLIWMSKNGSIIDLQKSLITLNPPVPVPSTKEVL